MGSNKFSFGVTIILSAAITATITIPMTVNLTKNNSVNNSNEMNVTVDGSLYEVTSDTITELATENGKLTTQNEGLKKENNELKQEVDSLSKEKESLKEQISNSEETDTTKGMAETTSEKVQLNDLTLVDSESYKIYEPFTDSYGNSYSIGYRLNASEGAKAIYSLKGEYKTFEFKVVAGEETSSDAEMTIIVSVDGKEIDTISGITKRTELQSAPYGPYDVTGARTIELTTNKTGTNSWGHCYLVEAYVGK